MQMEWKALSSYKKGSLTFKKLKKRKDAKWREDKEGSEGKALISTESFYGYCLLPKYVADSTPEKIFGFEEDPVKREWRKKVRALGVVEVGSERRARLFGSNLRVAPIAERYLRETVEDLRKDGIEVGEPKKDPFAFCRDCQTCPYRSIDCDIMPRRMSAGQTEAQKKRRKGGGYRQHGNS